MSRIADNVQQIHHQIADACAKSGRDPSSVKLIAVSKRKPVADILEAVRAGVQHFGENRVEEAEEKISAVMEELTDQRPMWHMVGHIQSRKARDIPGLFDVVHSVDSLKLAQKLSRQIGNGTTPLPVLIQVNTSGEDRKSGLSAFDWQSSDDVRTLLVQQVRAIVELPHLHVQGLMTMAPIVDHIEAVRPVFKSLAELRQMLNETLSLTLTELSMGMTDDFPVAVEEGATMVRVGRAIFGERD